MKNDGAAYVYGDNLFGLSKGISDAASENNIVLISRNTSIKNHSIKRKQLCMKIER